jgi:hypothetical protein
MSKIVERVSLYYREGRSDKVYVIELAEESQGKFSVTGYNGRRGSQLVAQPKTSTPVTLTEARRIFNQLESAKLNHPKTPYKIAERQTTTTTGAKQKEAKPPSVSSADEQAEATQQQPSPEGYRANHLDALEF